MTKIDESEETIEVICAFCGGHGRDPFGVMSPLSTCQVCGGSGRRILLQPIVPCAFCGATGVSPHYRLTCTSCGGVGMVHAQPGSVACPACGGTGRQENNELWPDSPFSCGYCRGIGVVSEIRAVLYASSKK